MTSPSTDWNSATAFTKRSRLSRRAAAACEGRGGELDVDAGRVDDPPDHVEQRVADVAAQPPQLGGQQGETLERLGRVAAPPGDSTASLSAV